LRTALALIAIAAAAITSLRAQEHLIPEAGTLAEHDEYYAKVTTIFAKARAHEVVCRVVILASFFPEQEVGVRQTPTGHEVYSITPSSAIWDTELIRLHESGQIQSFNKDGKELTLEEDASYQALKKRAPSDFRKITTEVKAVAVDDTLAKRIATLWERMLLATRYPREHRQGLDGESYHFSMFLSGRGVVSGKIWSPAEKTKTAALAELASTLALVVNGKADFETLKKAIVRAEKLTKA
jgi:hypothetical protein